MSQTDSNRALSRRTATAIFAAGLSALAFVNAPVFAAPAEGSLEWAVATPGRTPAEIARDAVRKPVEELTFMGIKPNHTVVEIYPGGGYFSAILGPYLAKGGGTLIAAGGRDQPGKAYKERFIDKPEVYGKIQFTTLNATSGPLVKDGTADAVVTFRNVHNMMTDNYGDKAFSDFFKALKPGGILGVEEHRAPATGTQDPKAENGYVQEAYVKDMAIKAGFEFVKASELLANPKDTKDHPFGVWTLPPSLQTAPNGQAANPNFDNAKYKAIGEADNMLLVFRKPTK
jgi:predicted methyltransferase